MERRSSPRAWALGMAGGLCAWGTASEARAEELRPGGPGEGRAGAQEEVESAERRAQWFRAELGVGTLGLYGPGFGGGTGAQGGLGGLGDARPYLNGNLTVGVRLTPAFWLFGGLRAGALSGSQGTGLPVGTAWDLGGEVGARLEIPLVPLVSVSGFASLGASKSVNYVASSTRLGGEIGGGLHLRPSDLFGIRAELGLLRAQHSFTEYEDPEVTGLDGVVDERSTSLSFGMSPRVAMTFSF
jgi:hypothetical protein